MDRKADYLVRDERIVSIADQLGGGVTLPILYAAFPDVEEKRMRALVARLVRRHALVAARAPALGGMLYLTTAVQRAGHSAGVYRLIKLPEQRAAAVETGHVPGSIVLPVWFMHNQIAARIAFGVGDGSALLEPELWVDAGAGSEIPDAEALPEHGRQVKIEVERMIGQSPNRWARRGGLADRAAKICLPPLDDSDHTTELLVVAPRALSRHPDLPAELSALVAERVRRPGLHAGFWFVEIADPDSDPEWRGLTPECQPIAALLGSRSVRLKHAPERRDRAATMAVLRRNAAAKSTVPPAAAAQETVRCS